MGVVWVRGEMSSLMLILFMRLEAISTTDPLLFGIDSGVNTEPLLDEGAGGLSVYLNQ